MTNRVVPNDTDRNKLAYRTHLLTQISQNVGFFSDMKKNKKNENFDSEDKSINGHSVSHGEKLQPFLREGDEA